MRGSEVIRLSVFFDHILQAEEQTGKHIPELLAEVKEEGISAVEINRTYLLEHPETLEMLETAGLQVSCIYEFYALERGRETEKARRHIEIARKAKAGKILIVPGFFSVETEEFVNCVPDREKVWDYLSHSEKALRMAEGLREIVEMAGSRNAVKDEKITEPHGIAGVKKIADSQSAADITPIAVVIEDFDDRNSPIASVSGMKWFAEQVPGLCFTFDTGNFIIHGEDIFAAWEELKDKVVHVHCKDRKISAEKLLKVQKTESSESLNVQKTESSEPLKVQKTESDEPLQAQETDADKAMEMQKIYTDKPLQAQENATPGIKECYLPAAVGEGCIPIKELVHKMKEYGYRGYLAIEHFDAADQEAYMQKSAANLQEYCS